MTTEAILAAPETQTPAELDPQAQTPATERQDDAKPEGTQDTKPELTAEQRAVRKLERRIHTLTAGRGAAQREAEMLREQLASAQARQDQTQADNEPQQRPAIDPREIEQLANARAAEIAHSRDIARRSQGVLTAGSKFDGFDDAVNTVADEIPFTDARGRPTPFIEAVLDSDKPASILHYLGNNPDEAAEFVGLTPAQIGRRIARLEDKIKAGTKQQTSNAPKPLQPVTGGAGGDKDPSRMTDSEFAAWRKSQIAKR